MFVTECFDENHAECKGYNGPADNLNFRCNCDYHKTIMTNEKDELPLWSDCELAVDERRASPLERFIYEYEPGDNDAEWRNRLQIVLTTARKEARAAAFKEAVEIARGVSVRRFPEGKLARTRGPNPLAVVQSNIITALETAANSEGGE